MAAKYYASYTLYFSKAGAGKRRGSSLEDVNAAKQVLRYISMTSEMGIRIPKLDASTLFIEVEKEAALENKADLSSELGHLFALGTRHWKYERRVVEATVCMGFKYCNHSIALRSRGSVCFLNLC